MRAARRVSVLGTVFLAAVSAMATTISVRPGDSLAAAQERARAAAKPVTVELADGLHILSGKLVFTAADSGVTWAAATGAKPILSGGVRVTSWTRNADGTWSAAVPKGRFFRQLTVNGRAAVRCREPNGGTFFTAGETVKPVGSHTAGDGKHPDLVYDPKDVDFTKIADKPAGEIRLFHWWSDVHLKIGSVNAASNIVTFAIPANKYTGRQWGPDGGKMSRYVLENFRQFLDAPGEWYLDAEAGRIDYLPRPGEKPDDPGFVAVAARMTRLAEIRGAKGLVFRGVGFRDADAQMAARDPINDEQGAACIDAAVVVDGARGCRFERCAFDLLDGYAVDVVGGARDVAFSRCSFADLGAGAVRIDGGRFDAAPRTQTRGIVVEDCEIGPYGRDWASGEGVLVKNAAQCRIAHNYIHDGYYTGVSLGWSWGYGDSVARDNVVEYNLIEDIGKEMLNDMGGVYTLGLSPGTVIRNNVVRRVRGWSYGGNCLYPDEGSQGILIENNLLCDAPTLIGAHYVREITVRNNILARQGGREMIGGGVYEPHVSMYVYGNVFYFTNGVPLTSWAVVPEFKSGGWESPWAYPFTVAGRSQYDKELRPNGPKRTDHVLGDWNVFWNPNGEDKKAKENAFTGKVNAHSVWADPLFVDAAKNDWRLKPDSPALKMGFEQIDFSAVGPRKEKDK